MKLKDIKQFKNPLFPFEQDVVIQAKVDQDTQYNTIRIETNPIYDKICEVAKKYKQKPFDKATKEIREILQSTLTPLEKLAKLQGLNFLEYFEKYKKDFQIGQKGKNFILT